MSGDQPSTPAAEALGISAGTRVSLLHAPPGFDDDLRHRSPADVHLQHGLRRTDQVDVVVGFVTEREHLGRNIAWITQTLGPGGSFWVLWPLATDVACDLTEDVVRQLAGPLGWIGARSCTIGGSWAGLQLMCGDPVTTAP